MSKHALPSDDDVIPDPLVAGEPISVPDSGDASEGGKLKTILALVKRSLGVKDIAAMRISLPASLLEPMPNLEYWMYLDRPDLFAAINDSLDPFERFLAVLRFTFSKDLKFVQGKIVKPYNSVLGEHFRAHWSVKPVAYSSDPNEPPIIQSHRATAPPSLPGGSESASLTSSRKSAPPSKKSSIKSPKLVPGTPKDKDLGATLAKDVSTLSLAGVAGDAESASGPIRVAFLTEQVSHHPPISSFHAAVPSKGIEATGVDQISARVSTTTLRVSPGSQNKGIFVDITSGNGAGEEYHITHPVAIVCGILRGNPYATISEQTFVTCKSPNAKQHLRAVIEYKDESWIGKAQFLLEGAIFEYDPESEEHLGWTKVKQIPSSKVLATFEGCWRGTIYWKRAGESTKQVLINMAEMEVVPKEVRPLNEQRAYESRKLWEKVSDNLIAKNYNDATKYKQQIEQTQRDLAAERKRTGKEFVPEFFEADISTGKPRLTEAGKKMLQEEVALP